MDPREIGIEFARHLSALVRREQQRPEMELHRLAHYFQGLGGLADFIQEDDGPDEGIEAAGKCMAAASETLADMVHEVLTDQMCQGGTKA